MLHKFSLHKLVAAQPLTGATQQVENPSVFYKVQYNDNSLPATGPAEVFYCLC